MRTAFHDSAQFLMTNDRKTILRRIRAREVPPLVQFFMYSVCGVLATIIFLGTVMILSQTLIPAYEGMIVNGAPIDKDLRAYNYTVNSCIAFVISNALAYLTNVWLVFKPGRHHPILEFLYFTFVSSVAFAVSLVAGPLLIKLFNVNTNLALFTNTIAAMMLNFAGRKFFVFKG